MKPEAQLIAIAEADGWTTFHQGPTGKDLKFVHQDGRSVRTWKDLPRYLDDLNAMHRVEATLPRRTFYIYVNNLKDICSPSGMYNGHEGHEVWASAIQRAEAFLRTIGKWEDGE